MALTRLCNLSAKITVIRCFYQFNHFGEFNDRNSSIAATTHLSLYFSLSIRMKKGHFHFLLQSRREGNLEHAGPLKLLSLFPIEISLY